MISWIIASVLFVWFVIAIVKLLGNLFDDIWNR